MTLQIDLPPADEVRLKAEAERHGVRPEEFVRTLVRNALVVGPPDIETAALMDEWIARDATDDPEELARGERSLEAFKSAMNETRLAAGARILYP